jgi:hypothetical protein
MKRTKEITNQRIQEDNCSSYDYNLLIFIIQQKLIDYMDA